MLIDKKSRSLIFHVKVPTKITDIIPKSRVFEHKGEKLVQVFHGVDETKILNNLGFTVPSPILYYYEWPKIKGKFDPFDHQVVMAAFKTLNDRCFNLSTMGVGKSEASLMAADFLIQQKLVRKVLIVAPLSCLEKVWADALFSSFPEYNFVVLHGSAAKRKELLQQDVNFFIINHDGIKTIEEELKKCKDIDLIIGDEAGTFRNAATGLYKSFKNIIQPHQRLWLLTGTPTPNAPTDAWALATLVDPTRVPKFFGSWKRQTMLQISPFKWIPQKDAHEKVFNALQPVIRFEKSQCLSLPPVTFSNRECEMTPDQKTHYKSMKHDLVMNEKGVDITAVNAADKVGKLRQILCGAIKADEDDYVPLDCKPRINLVLEIISEAAAKVIVIVPYKGILKMLKAEIGKHHTCEVINGDVPINKRNEIFTNFQTQKHPKILICHPKVMAHGLSLTAADCIIFYAPISSNDQFEQACERIPRPGQVNSMSIVCIGANSLEWQIYEGLKAKKNFQGMALDLYRTALEEK